MIHLYSDAAWKSSLRIAWKACLPGKSKKDERLGTFDGTVVSNIGLGAK